MAITAAGVLVEDWSKNHALAWQRQVLTLQASQLAEQKESYISFNDALTKQDPILLERLAMTQLRLKPQHIEVPGANTRQDILVRNAANSARPATISDTRPEPQEHRVLPAIVPVEELLAKQIAVPGETISEYSAPRSTLISICTGNSRLGVIAAGILCIIAGLIAPTDDEESTDSEKADPTTTA
jgi:hypothetical protein